jgi:hypothetical protein
MNNTQKLKQELGIILEVLANADKTQTKLTPGDNRNMMTLLGICIRRSDDMRPEEFTDELLDLFRGNPQLIQAFIINLCGTLAAVLSEDAYSPVAPNLGIGGDETL